MGVFVVFLITMFSCSLHEGRSHSPLESLASRPALDVCRALLQGYREAHHRVNLSKIVNLINKLLKNCVLFFYVTDLPFRMSWKASQV